MQLRNRKVRSSRHVSWNEPPRYGVPDRDTVKDWSVDDVVTFLEECEKLTTIGDIIRESAITGHDLLEISAEDLQEIGVSNHMHRKKILRAVEHIHAAAEPKSAEADKAPTQNDERRTDGDQDAPVLVMTWKFALFRAFLLILVFFFLNTLMNYFVLDPWLGRNVPRTPELTNEEILAKVQQSVGDDAHIEFGGR
mgnify:FL=1